MASTILGSGVVTFGDGTTLSSTTITLAQVTGAPTALSQFTNNLGNYGSYLTSANVNTTLSGYYASNEIGYRYLNWDGSQWSIIVSNCNCNCNC
jgi:hypothetical protein